MAISLNVPNQNVNIGSSPQFSAPTATTTPDGSNPNSLANVAYVASAGYGNVTGPVSAQDYHFAAFNGATGNVIRNTGIYTDSFANLYVPGSIYSTGQVGTQSSFVFNLSHVVSVNSFTPTTTVSLLFADPGDVSGIIPTVSGSITNNSIPKFNSNRGFSVSGVTIDVENNIHCSGFYSNLSQLGGSGSLGILTMYPSSVGKGETVFYTTDNTGNYVLTITNDPISMHTILNIANPGVANAKIPTVPSGTSRVGGVPIFYNTSGCLVDSGTTIVNDGFSSITYTIGDNSKQGYVELKNGDGSGSSFIIGGFPQEHSVQLYCSAFAQDTELVIADPGSVNGRIPTISGSITNNSILVASGTSGKLVSSSATIRSGTLNITAINSSGTIGALNLSAVTCTLNDLKMLGVGAVIEGDYSNATLSNRAFLKTTVSSSATHLSAVPSGASSGSSWDAYLNSDMNNSSIFMGGIDSTSAYINSGVSGTGTQLPLSFQIGGTTKASIDTSGNFICNFGLLILGETSFFGDLNLVTANRFKAQFSTPTISNRFMFKTSSPNDLTSVGAIPNGTGVSAEFSAYNNSSPENSSLISVGIDTTSAYINSTQSGTGTTLGLQFRFNNSSVASLDSSGNLSTNTSVKSPLIQAGNSGTAGTLDIYPSTASKGKLRLLVADNSANYPITLTNASFGQSTTLTIPDPSASTGIIPVISGTADNLYLPYFAGTTGKMKSSGIRISGAAADVLTVSELVANDMLVNLVKSVTINAGQDGVEGFLSVFAPTSSKGYLSISCQDNTNNSFVTISNQAVSTNTLYLLPATGTGFNYLLGTGDSITDNEIPRYDGTGGGVQSSGVTIDDSHNVSTTGSYRVSGTQVVTSRQSAVADASGGSVVDTEARAAINALLARVRTHGLIAT